MHLHRHAQVNPGKPALFRAEDGSTLTFGDLDSAANQSAHLIRSLGMARGDVVATIFANAPEVFVLNWAAQVTELYVTAVSPKLSVEDIAYIVRDSGAKVLVASDCFVELAIAVAAMAGTSIAVFSWGYCSPKLPSWSTQATLFPRHPVDHENPGSDLLYSSGTTGRPKGVMAPLPEGTIYDETSTSTMARGLYAMNENTVYLSTSPLYHAAPLRWALAVQKLGGVVILMDSFDAEQAVHLIDRFKVTHATFVPTHFVRMLKLPEAVRDRYDVGSLKAAIHSAAPCAVPVKRAMIDWFGPVIFEYYSGTECCGVTALNTQEWLERPGSVGRAVLGTLHIVDDAGRELAAGETGNVYFSDGPKFQYLNDPDKTAEAHDARGWATMGDIGHYDANGYLYLSDRKAFMVISGGVNIYPLEIENALIVHPEVSDIAVVGLPDDEMGEKVVAFIHPAHWPVRDEVELRNKLAAFAREKLGPIKAPKAYHFCNDLPREPTGKMMKRRIINEFTAGAADGSTQP